MLDSYLFVLELFLFCVSAKKKVFLEYLKKKITLLINITLFYETYSLHE